MTLILVVVVWNIVKLMISKGNNESNKRFEKSNDILFLGNVNFSDGHYVLYIRHKELGEFAVVNQESLEANKAHLKIKVSLLNYLPGEGDRYFGAMLFKNGKLVKEKKGGVFKIFEIGNLKHDAVAVQTHQYSGIKSEIRKKIEILKKMDNSYIYRQPNLSSTNKDFYFRIYFPTIAVPVTRDKNKKHNNILTINGIDYSEWHIGNDGGFNKNWKRKIETCIRNKGYEISDFDLSVSSGTLSDAYLFDTSQDGHRELRDADNHILYLEDFMYYQYSAYVGANKKDVSTQS